MLFSATLIAFFATLAIALPAAEPVAAEPDKQAPPPAGSVRIDGTHFQLCKLW